MIVVCTTNQSCVVIKQKLSPDVPPQVECCEPCPPGPTEEGAAIDPKLSADKIAESFVKRTPDIVKSVTTTLEDKSFWTIAKILVIPFLILGAQKLFSYSRQRFNLIKTLRIDLAYRIANAISAYQQLFQWNEALNLSHKTLTNAPTPLPHLRPHAEEHFLYKSLQLEMMHSLWGKEVQTVREAYRGLDILEKRVQIIRTQYERLATLMTETAKLNNDANPNGLSGLSPLWDSAIEDINHNVRKYHDTLDFLLGENTPSQALLVLCQTTRDPDWHYGKKKCEYKFLGRLSGNLFISIFLAYGTQLVAPLILIGLSVAWIYTDGKLPEPWRLTGEILAVIWVVVFIWVNARTLRPIRT